MRGTYLPGGVDPSSIGPDSRSQESVRDHVNVYPVGDFPLEAHPQYIRREWPQGLLEHAARECGEGGYRDASLPRVGISFSALAIVSRLPALDDDPPPASDGQRRGTVAHFQFVSRSSGAIHRDHNTQPRSELIGPDRDVSEERRGREGVGALPNRVESNCNEKLI
ncbi:hypothetical protein R1flu_023244 [Riccia fluitans]|uniref:Uncharacterized protein n=1 Tax=Riccia fluitans TaxID=41844 RepID=A0ABD1XRI1_9MARC